MTRPALCSALLVAMLAVTLAGCAQPAGWRVDWTRRLVERLPVLGHRNWVVVADSAYPAQSAVGIETVYVGGDQLTVVQRVLAAVDGAPHVRAKVLLDSELTVVPEADAPGVAAYRERLGELLKGRPVEFVPHEQIIGRLDRAAGTFSVLIVKTDMVLPYTSVFLELDCGYWGAEQEQRLRDALQNAPRGRP